MTKKYGSEKPAKPGEGKMADKENKKKPNPTDMHVGSRIRLRRNMLGMSQEKLGENLGITFQQIQKYEKGTNRVGASRLQAIANILGVPVAFFFEDLPGPEGGRKPRLRGRSFHHLRDRLLHQRAKASSSTAPSSRFPTRRYGARSSNW